MAESMATGWYYMQGGAAGRQQGPVTWEELYAARSSGSLQPSDMVWHSALPQWTPAAQIPGLFAAEAQTAVRQQAPYSQAAYQQPSYQQAGQPAWAGQGAYQAAPRSRSRLLAWLIPVIAVVIIGAGLGAYFGIWYGKGAGDSLPASYYGDWKGVITYTSIDINDATDAEKASRDQILDTEIPVTIELYEGKDGDVAYLTIDISSVEPGRDELTDTFTVTYSEADDELAFESERSRDTAKATIAKQAGVLVMEGELAYEAVRDSGEAVFEVSQ